MYVTNEKKDVRCKAMYTIHPHRHGHDDGEITSFASPISDDDYISAIHIPMPNSLGNINISISNLRLDSRMLAVVMPL